MSKKKRLVILDRDGTINRDSANFVRSVSQWQPLPGSIDAIARLTSGGYTVVVATNQSGIGRGFLTVTDLHQMHQRLVDEVKEQGGEIAGLFYCPHLPGDQCECRKPAPGLLLKIAERFDCELQAVPVIGDSRRDMEAAAAVGARAILVRTGNGAATEERLLAAGENPEVYDTLATAAEALLADD